MLRSVGLRILQALATLWVTSVLVWSLMLFAPGDPAVTVLAADGISQPLPVQVQAMRQQLGLDQPLPERYWHWLTGVLHGSFGLSWQTGAPVMNDFGTRLPATLRLTVAAIGIALVLSLALGLTCAATVGRWPDPILRGLTLVMAVVPSFLIGLFVLNVLVIHFNIGVVVADGSWSTVWWPALTLALASSAHWSRVLRASVLEARSAPHLLVSHARGASGWRRMFVHVLPNAIAPFLTMVALGIAALIGGAPIVESVYTWPGVGNYTVSAIEARDLPVVAAYTILAVALYIVTSLLIDLILAFIDPRIRLQGVRISRSRRLRWRAALHD